MQIDFVNTHQFIAELTLAGMGFDALGGCYLAYDLLGGKRGPLRTIARATGYVALFFIGYVIVLGLRYGLVAASGMGVLLAIELRRAASGQDEQKHGNAARLFAFLRGIVLGLAGMTVAGPLFGAFFGIFSALSLMVVSTFGFAPASDYERKGRPSLSRHKMLSTFFRALAVSVAGVAAAFFAPSADHGIFFGLRLGLAAGTVNALVVFFSPVIEWKIENLPEKQLGVLGLALIFIGMILQSIQYWVAVFNVPVP